MPEVDETAAGAPRRRTTTWATPALVALLALALVGLAVYVLVSSQRHDTALVDVSTQLRDMSAQQTLLAARLDATPTLSTESTSKPTPASAIPEQPDTGQRVFAKILGAKPNNTGWDIEIRVGKCYTGDAGFSLATSRGELPVDGYYIMDDATSTVSVRMLKATPVVVAGWDKSTAETSSIAAADLVDALAGGADPRSPWDTSWYWLNIREMIATSAEQYLGPVGTTDR